MQIILEFIIWDVAWISQDLDYELKIHLWNLCFVEYM